MRLMERIERKKNRIKIFVEELKNQESKIKEIEDELKSL
jgi:hypothetical protein